MPEQDRPTGARGEVELALRGWHEPARSREVQAVLDGDRYDKCPLRDAGFALEQLPELGAVVVGADGRCICTYKDRCLDVDRRDGNRCTLEDLRRLDQEAARRRGWQS